MTDCDFAWSSSCQVCFGENEWLQKVVLELRRDDSSWTVWCPGFGWFEAETISFVNLSNSQAHQFLNPNFIHFKIIQIVRNFIESIVYILTRTLTDSLVLLQICKTTTTIPVKWYAVESVAPLHLSDGQQALTSPIPGHFPAAAAVAVFWCLLPSELDSLDPSSSLNDPQTDRVAAAVVVGAENKSLNFLKKNKEKKMVKKTTWNELLEKFKWQ